MILNDQEKASILTMKMDDEIKVEDEMYQYEIERVSKREFRVSKWAIMCLSVEYFFSAKDVIKYIEDGRLK